MGCGTCLKGWQCRRCAIQSRQSLLRMLADTGQHGAARCSAFISSTSSSRSPQRSAGRSVGLPSARTRRWAAEGDGRCGAIGAVGLVGEAGIDSTLHGEEKDYLPPVLPPCASLSSSPPRNPRTPGHRVKAHGRRLTVASLKWVSRDWYVAMRAFIFFLFKHILMLVDMFLYRDSVKINPSGLLVIRYVRSYVD